MFTGIIEDIGTVVSIKNGVIKVKTSLDDIAIGDSISINGVCLTVTALKQGTLEFDYTPETVSVSTITKLKAGDKTNIERAMKASGRLGGHIVSGHVEAVGRVMSVTKEGNSHLFRLSLPADIARYVVEKGSIAIDGISLTVADRKDKWFTVSVIPHTMVNTTLSLRKPGSLVNLEADVLARYNEKTRVLNASSRLSSSFLKENGFFRH